MDNLSMARNEIKCYAKGGVNEASKYFQTKNTSQMQSFMKKLEEENEDLRSSIENLLQQMRSKDEEIKYLQGVRDENAKKIKSMAIDLKNSP